MTIKICDRCKKQYNLIPGILQVKFPSYNITTTEGVLQGRRQVDLCDDCQKEFEAWMKGKKKRGKENEY